MLVKHILQSDQRMQVLGFWALRVLLILVAATVLLYLLAVTPLVPYHVRELFGPHPTLGRAFLLALVALFAFGPPALLGLQLIRLPPQYVWLFPLGILLHAAVVFLGFRYATPIASVQDMLGLPVWGIAPEWERGIRFAALFVTVSVSVAGGTAMLYAVTRSYAPRRLLWWVLFAGLFLLASYFIVVVHAATDNLTILLRGEASLFSWAALCLWLLLLAFGSSLIAERLAGVFKGTLTVLFALLLFLPLTYGALLLAVEPSVLGPNTSLSALEFLLTPSRERYGLSGIELGLRYAFAYAALMLLLTMAQYPVWLGYSARRFAAAPLLDARS